MKFLLYTALLTCMCLLVVMWILVAPDTEVQAQGRLVWFTIPDLTMTGSALRFSSTGQSARLCQVTALTANTAVVRWGDSAITASRGSTIAAGGGQFIPPGGTGSSYAVDLTTTYVIGTAGDKVAVTCAR